MWCETAHPEFRNSSRGGARAVFARRATRAAGTYYVTVAGLGGEPDYEQRFTAMAGDLDKVLKGSGSDSHVYTLSGADATERA